MIDINTLSNKSGIYLIRNNINNKYYIGSSTDIKRRIANHKCKLNSNKHYNTRLQNSWNKYKEENFSLEILEYCNREFLTKNEQNYIDNLKPFFNIRPTVGSTLGSYRTPKWRRNISKGKMGVKNPQAKLTIEQVKEIRNSKLRVTDLAKIYNISKAQISMVRNYKSYTECQ